MSLNNNVGAPAIFYLCATSRTIALLATLASLGTAASAASVEVVLPSLGANTSPNMHNSTDMQANAVAAAAAAAAGVANEQKSNNLNHFQKNNRNDSIMALSPSLSTPSGDRNNGTHSNNEHHSDQHSFEMENSRKYLHLDEHNFVATTPKIQTTQLPNR